MGKRYGKHSMSQEEICGILIDKAREGKMVVRLKGGDPFVFGRGGEEIRVLEKEGIRCHMAGIPVTYRGVSQSVHIVTAHTADTEDGFLADLDKIAGLQGTLVFLMGLNQLEKLAQRLVRAGRDEKTPAAVISGGNAPCPAFVRGTLGTIAEETKKKQVKAPAVIVVGEVVGLAHGKAPG